MFRYLSLLVVLTFSFINSYAQNAPNFVKDERVHEAFLSFESDKLVLDAVPLQPPPNLQEEPPEAPDTSAIWIPGYFAFSEKRRDFVWVCGVWRKPPPGKVWISGFWKQYEEGFVWNNGFWSDSEELVFLPQMPPDRIEEEIPRTSQKNVFWMPGFWQFSQEQYVWVGGSYVQFDPYWIYVPGHYVFRDEGGERSGFVFIAPYWDFPLDQRGSVYACASFTEEKPTIIVISPELVIDPAIIVEIYYPYWPEYLCSFHYFYYYFPDFWQDFAWGVPPWWGWPEWWGLNWVDSLWLWWWWSHPEFAAPYWLDAALADQIAPPSPLLVQNMAQVVPTPLVVANKGVVAPTALAGSIKSVSGAKKPIISALPETKKDIYEATKVKSNNQALKPTGKLGVKTPPAKPVGVETGEQNKITAPQKPKTPKGPKPTLDKLKKPTTPEIQKPIKPQTPLPEKPTTPRTPETEKPTTPQIPQKPVKPIQPVKPESVKPQTPLPEKPAVKPEAPLRTPETEKPTTPQIPQKPAKPIQPVKPESVKPQTPLPEKPALKPEAPLPQKPEVKKPSLPKQEAPQIPEVPQKLPESKKPFVPKEEPKKPQDLNPLDEKPGLIKPQNEVQNPKERKKPQIDSPITPQKDILNK